MNKKGIAVAVVAVFAAVSGAQAAGSLEGLSGAGEKIASVDMKKDFNKAGGVLNDFFSGSLTKKTSPSEETSAVSASKTSAGPARNIYGQTADQLVNAKASKISKLSSEVKPLAGKNSFEAAAGKDKGWWEDAHTVGDYVGNVAGHAYDTASDAADIVVHGPSIYTDSDGHVGSNVTDLYHDAVNTYHAANCTD